MNPLEVKNLIIHAYEKPISVIRFSKMHCKLSDEIDRLSSTDDVEAYTLLLDMILIDRRRERELEDVMKSLPIICMMCCDEPNRMRLANWPIL